jgi:membrane-associated protease RseP (regulator of RpoE activity)
MFKKPPRSIVVGAVFTCLILALVARAFAQVPGKPRLGVKLEPAANGEGIVITEVMYGYAAETAGLRAGDVVVRVGEEEITGIEAFRKAVGSIGDGATVPFVVVRDGAEQTIQVKMQPPHADAPGAKPPAKPELREELLKMREKDQGPRHRLSEELLGDDEQQKLMEEMTAIDAANRERLKQIIAEHGFPTVSMVGQDGADTAFLIVQHGDRDPEWQASMLPVLEELSKKGEASKASVAYLTDRVLRAQGKPQLYGTQYYQEQGPSGSPEYVPPVVQDPKNLDQRRLSMGLGKWANYEAQMARIQNRDPFPAPRGPGGK